mgnify:CR=1 FL=1
MQNNDRELLKSENRQPVVIVLNKIKILLNFFFTKIFLNTFAAAHCFKTMPGVISNVESKQLRVVDNTRVVSGCITEYKLKIKNSFLKFTFDS